MAKVFLFGHLSNVLQTEAIALEFSDQIWSAEINP